MKSRFAFAALAVLILFIAIRCSIAPNSIDLDNVSTYFMGKYSARLTDSEVHLHLVLENREHLKVLEREDAIDISKGYRLKMDSRLKEIATDIISKTPKLDADLSILALQALIDDYAKSHKPAEMGSEQAQGMFYYLAIFKLIRRYNLELATNKLAVLRLTTYNGYIVGLSPYHAKEDIIINSQSLIKYLSGNPTRLTAPEAKVIIKILNEYTLPEISLSVLESKVDLEVLEQSKVLRTAWLEGGDCGCCGNYEGTCYFASGNCWVHDYLCQTCWSVWFCFGGCKPTPCA